MERNGILMLPVVEFFFEFASTYSYPAAMRVDAIAAETGVEVHWRPFLLGAIFKAQGWDTSPFNLYEAKGRYMWRDLARICAADGLPFRRPDPFPQNSLLAARVALVGLKQAWGKEFVRAVYRAEFADGRNIADENVLTDLLRAVGEAPEETLALARSEEIKAELRGNTAAAEERGIFGAPSFVADGELFWGNDRLEQAFAWARNPGAGGRAGRIGHR